MRELDPEVFRLRLAESVGRSGLTKAAFAEQAGVDRTTLSQLLSPGGRLPRLESLVAIAAAHDLSLDWLLGRADQPDPAAEMLEHTSFAHPGPAASDERLYAWFMESGDLRVRYVPATLPDLLKTDAVIRYEKTPANGPTPAQTMETTASRLAWARNRDSEMECASSAQGLRGFARGEGIWQRLGAGARAEQLERMIELCDELYPAFRWYLFDGLARYAAPITIFGRRRAAVYLGGLYLVLTEEGHVRTLCRHFDGLIKVATVQPTAVPAYLARLRKEI